MGNWKEAAQKVCAKAGLVEGGGRGYTMEPVGGMAWAMANRPQSTTPFWRVQAT